MSALGRHRVHNYQNAGNKQNLAGDRSPARLNMIMLYLASTAFCTRMALPLATRRK